MKSIFPYVIVLLLFTNCKAQHNQIVEQELIIPQITKEFESFDIEKYNNMKNNEEVQVRQGDTLVVYIDYSSGYSKSIYNNKSIFHTVKNFYLNGKIENKGITFNNGSEYGVWYEFDQEGNFIKEINTDEGYDFGWLDVIKYCNKHQIKLDQGYPKRGGIKTEIYKVEEEGEKVWIISYYDPTKEQIFEVTLDGKTGKELKRRKLALIGG